MRIAQYLDPVCRRHFDIGDDNVINGTINPFLARLTGGDCFDLVPVTAQSNIEHFTDRALVIAYQDVSHAHSLLLQPLPWPYDQPGLGRSRAVPRLVLRLAASEVRM